MNWLRFLAGNLTDADRVMVFTHETPQKMEVFDPGSPRIEVYRHAGKGGGTALTRYRGYLAFYFSTIRWLKRFRPDTVLYYESLSAIPALYYKYFIARKSRIFVHYHEYTSPMEYRGSMLINHRSHLLEKRMYPVFSGITHTNQTRLELFTADNPDTRLPRQDLWPNYPPAAWTRDSAETARDGTVRFVYAGALDTETMFVKAFATWIQRQNGAATWDIYSWNCTPETRRYLGSLKTDAIRYHEGVSYFALPEILSRYDVGVILYKGHIANYVHNAPNKLFEYWSCGLDVWFPVQMTGAMPFVSSGVFPRISAIDFEQLEGSAAEKTDRSGLAFRPSPYSSESVAGPYLNRLRQS